MWDSDWPLNFYTGYNFRHELLEKINQHRKDISFNLIIKTQVTDDTTISRLWKCFRLSWMELFLRPEIFFYFGPYFIKWIKILYKNPSFRFKNKG